MYNNPMGQVIGKTRIEKFWNGVEKTEGCWERKYGRGPYGHSRFGQRPNRVLAHRFSWEYHNGPIPEGLFVLHRCDNGACVRPDHLFLGTQMDNMRDKIAKGRARYVVPSPRKGSSNSQSKLTDEQVRYIRTSEKTTVALAAELGVSQATAWNVRNRVRYADVGD